MLKRTENVNTNDSQIFILVLSLRQEFLFIRFLIKKKLDFSNFSGQEASIIIQVDLGLKIKFLGDLKSLMDRSCIESHAKQITGLFHTRALMENSCVPDYWHVHYKGFCTQCFKIRGRHYNWR